MVLQPYRPTTVLLNRLPLPLPLSYNHTILSYSLFVLARSRDKLRTRTLRSSILRLSQECADELAQFRGVRRNEFYSFYFNFLAKYI